MLTLWDLIRPVVPGPARRRQRQEAASSAQPPSPSAPAQRPARQPSPAREAMRDRYDRVAREMLARYGVRVRKWRSSMSGIAWQVEYRDGTVARLIEAPRPRGPMSAAVFLHEIGHHAIGFHVYKPRCLEEYHAWAFALRQMEAHGLNITDAVRRRMHESLKYAVDKARRRGLRRLPPELAPYTRPAPPRAGRRPRRIALAATPRPPGSGTPGSSGRRTRPGTGA